MASYCKATGKQRHKTQTEAVGHLIALKKKDGGLQCQTYRCKLCGGGWHVGHRRIYRRRKK